MDRNYKSLQKGNEFGVLNVRYYTFSRLSDFKIYTCNEVIERIIGYVYRFTWEKALQG